LNTYIAFLRGINVGGHHKVPMATLRLALEAIQCKNVQTLLNSGNIIFDAANTNPYELETSVNLHFQDTFGFPIPTLIRKAETIVNYGKNDPFNEFARTNDLRFYVSFLEETHLSDLKLPLKSEDGSFKIMEIRDTAIFSILDLSKGKTPAAMGVLEQIFGKHLTTRNWNTINRILKKLEERL
jgi:uncharacterized protein (DUF1697 family)